MTDDTDRESAVMVLDVESLILDEAYNRGLDPSGLEIIDSKTSDEHELVVQVEGSSVHTATEHGGGDC